MRYSSLFYTFLLTGSVLASDFVFDTVPHGFPGLEVRQSTGCGATNGDCNKNGCNGFNDANGSTGRCLSGGSIEGCPCNSVCGTPGPCNQAGCEGINDFEGGPGICTAGDFKGCTCASVCNGVMGACDQNGCEGINAPGGQPGICTAGGAQGCLCNSVCGAQSGSCSADSCQGNDEGICTVGEVKGCPCVKDSQACGNLDVGSCSDNNCNGVFNANDGFGICQGGGKIQGCPCTQ